MPPPAAELSGGGDGLLSTSTLKTIIEINYVNKFIKTNNEHMR